MFKQKGGGGGKGFLKNVQKTALFLSGGFPQGIHTPNCFGRCWDFFTYRPPIKNHKKLYNVYFVFKAGWDCQTSPRAAGTKIPTCSEILRWIAPFLGAHEKQQTNNQRLTEVLQRNIQQGIGMSGVLERRA